MPNFRVRLSACGGVDVLEDVEGDCGPCEDILVLGMPGIGTLGASCSCGPAPSNDPLTFLEDTVEEGTLLSALLNQCGKRCLRLKPPGGRRSSSVALTVSEFEDPVLYVYVVKGVTSGWKISLTNMINGGKIG